MSYKNYQNIYISGNGERFTAENIIQSIEQAAIDLVTKTIAEANAEEILDIVLDHAFDIVCPQIPCLQDSDSTPSLINILTVLEMENSLPTKQKTSINYHRSTKSEESLEEPVFTSPIYVKSGPENINILEDKGMSERYVQPQCPSPQEQELESSVELKYMPNKNVVKSEGTNAEIKEQILGCGSQSKMYVDNACINFNNIQMNENDDSECSENIGDANDLVNNTEKIETKSTSSEQKLSLAGQAIGDVPDLPLSDNEEIHPQIVQAFVLYPEAPAQADDKITTKTENALTTEMEGDSIDVNNLEKEEDTLTSNEEIVERIPTLVANEVGDLLHYFQQEYNTLETTVSVNVFNKSSNVGSESSTIYEEVKRAVKEIAAAVFEGQGDGTPTELSNISIHLNQNQSSTSEVLAGNPKPPTRMGQIWGSPMEAIQKQSTSASDKEEEIAVHETLSEETELTKFLTNMHHQDEVEEKEVQVILHDDEHDIIGLNNANFDSDSDDHQFSDYLAAARKDSHEGFTYDNYRSCSHLDLSARRSYIETSKLKKVETESYTLEKMARNMEEKNPHIKANCTVQPTGQIRNASELKPTGERSRELGRSKWSRVRKLLTCASFQCNKQSSDEQ